MLSDYFQPHFGGGVEQVVARLCDGLVERGHDVTVLTLRTCPSPATESRGALTIHRLAAVDLTRWLGIQFSLSLRTLDVVARLIRSLRPDVVHAHNMFFRTTEAAALLRKFLKFPLVTTLHLGKAEGGSKLFNTLIRGYESTVGRFIVRGSEHVIAVSRAVAEHARRIGVEAASVTVIPNGVDIRLFHPGTGQRNNGKEVLYVGRLVPNKGPEVLLRAVPAVLDKHPQAKFVLVGDGPLRSRLEIQARQMDIGHAVHFLGMRYDVPELMREAALLVRPSMLEGMPLTILEAMASALPVVATPVGGTPEILEDGVHGYLTPVDDSMKLADAIIRLLDNDTLAREMGRHGRQMVETAYTWDTMVDQTEKVYIEEARSGN